VYDNIYILQLIANYTKGKSLSKVYAPTPRLQSLGVAQEMLLNNSYRFYPFCTNTACHI